MKNRILSIMLVMCMLLSVLPLTPFTAIAATTADPPAAAENTVTVGDFTIKPTDVGATLIEGVDYTYSGNVLTVCSVTKITVSGKTTQDRIEVASDIDAHITLAGVDINVSGNNDFAAFKIADDSTGNVTVVSATGTENSLISGQNCAGLQKNGEGDYIGTLTVSGDGALLAQSGATVILSSSCGAGIGGGNEASTAKIRIIGANVSALSVNGAGIGGGYGAVNGGNLTDIVIQNSTIRTEALWAAGIGGGYGSTRGGGLENITVENSMIDARSTSTAGIGGGGGGKIGGDLTGITLKNSAVTATSDSGYSPAIGGGIGFFASGTEPVGKVTDITVIGCSLKLSGAVPIGNGYNSNNAASAVVPIDGAELLIPVSDPVFTGKTLISVDGVSFPAKHKYFDKTNYAWVTEDTVYPYMPVGYHDITYTTSEGKTETKSIRVNPDGSLTFAPYNSNRTQTAEGGFKVYGEKSAYTYSDGVLRITGTSPIMVKNLNASTPTNHRIEVANGVDAHITLESVNIDVSSVNERLAAFKIDDEGTGNVTVVLAGNTTNTLKSGRRCAGLQKIGIVDTVGTLTVCGSGKLLAYSASDGSGYGAGIGGGDKDSTSKINIIGANITAKSETGAGIGGGWYRSASKISIIGANINAESLYGAGIGAGHNGGDASDIYIQNSTITAKSTTAAGIGTAFNELGGYFRNITLIGSSINASGKFAIGGETAVTPTDGDGNPLYLLTISNPNDEAVKINGKAWSPLNHKAVDSSDSNLYAYVPGIDGAYSAVTVGGKTTVKKFSEADRQFHDVAAVAALLAANGTVKNVYDTPQAAVDASSNGDKLMLLAACTVSSTLSFSNNNKLTLDLNGFVLKKDGSGSVINISSGAALILIDSTPTAAHKFTPGTDGLWALDEATGTETVTGGIITGGSYDWGGGVYNSGTFKMAGGSIVGCKASRSGGGVINNGTFIMQSGNIAGCTAQWGGGVMNSGTATLSGSITGCKATETGGGVQIDGGTLTLQNGTISGCTATEKGGGGVYNKSTFVLKSGNITGCTTYLVGSGGGVFNNTNASFTMEAGKLENCYAPRGGGVCNNGTFTMKSGDITGCYASGDGGGVYNNVGTFTMEGGSITGCSVIGTGFNGGGVYNKSTFVLKSGNITGCTATEDGGGVYQENNADIISNGGSIIGDVSGDGRITRSDDATDYTTFTGTVSAINIDPKACPYTVTFDSNGGSAVATQYVLKGQAPKTVDDPTREYFSFVRWHTEGSDTAYDFSTVLTASVELKAKWRDETAPTGEIKLGTNSWKKFLNSITFGLFFKNTQEVTVTAADNDGEAVKIEYLLSDTELTVTELEAKSFTLYTDKFTVSPNHEYVIYAKLTDSEGNVSYINSNGIVLDDIVPVISGITDGETYCEEQTVTVTESYVDSVTVNGSPVTLDANGKFKLTPANGTQTVVVTDKAGNVSAEMIVTVNDGHETDTPATCNSKAVCKHCGIEYGEVDGNNHSSLTHKAEKAATANALGNIEHWYCNGCNKYFTDSAAANALSSVEETYLYAVIFNTDGGSPVSNKFTVKWEDEVLNGIANPTRDGYEFIGWECGTTGVTDSTKYSALAANKSTASVELKAKWRDETAPTGEIKLGTNSWKKFLNSITFGLFFKNTQEVTVTAADNDGEAVKIEYLLSDTELTVTELEAKSFTLYTDKFTVSPNHEYVIYAKLTDSEGNVSYINSNGIVLDDIVPVISGITDGETYCEEQTVTVTESYVDSVTVNGSPVTLDANGKFKLTPANGTQTVVVTDKAGNVSAEMIVTVNDGHTYEWASGSGKYWKKCKFCNDETAKKDIPEVAVKYPKTVCKTQDFVFTLTLPKEISDVSYGFNFEHKSDGDFNMTGQNGVLTGIIESSLYAPAEDSFELITVFTTADGFEFSATRTIAVQAEHSGGTATCTAKAKCDICGEEYGNTDGGKHDLEHNKKNPATVTSTGTKEYWHCKDCEKNFSDKDGKNEITLADTVIPKLAPEIIEGVGQSLTAGESKELTFRSNAAFADFIRVEVDGETLDEKNYTVKEGSTVVTLKADYVATLSAGVHTLGIVSESGTATTTFTVVAKATTSDTPQTGDNTRIALWIALFFVSGGVSIGTGVYFKKKKRAAK